jgi:hypothetical protein
LRLLSGRRWVTVKIPRNHPPGGCDGTKIREREEGQKKGRLDCISHLLSLIPCTDPRLEEVKLGRRSLKDKYDDEAVFKGRRFIFEKFWARMMHRPVSGRGTGAPSVAHRG